MKTKQTGRPPRKKLRGHTVILAYLVYGQYDSDDIRMSWVTAESPANAVEHARKRYIKDTKCGEWGDPPGSDLEPVAVFAGWLEDVNP